MEMVWARVHTLCSVQPSNVFSGTVDSLLGILPNQNSKGRLPQSWEPIVKSILGDLAFTVDEVPGPAPLADFHSYPSL